VGIARVIDVSQLTALRQTVRQIHVADSVLNYIGVIVRKTREADQFVLGASPRAGIAVLICSKAMAALQGRNFVTPDDVKAVLLPVLRHRVLLRPEAEIEGVDADDAVMSVLNQVPVPR
jgi:MoxR-like ATPase